MHGFELGQRLNGISEWRHRGNGLTVLTAPTPVAPVVGFAVVYRVGSRHEVPGHTGATHMLEHLMFKGSEAFNAERGTEIARSLHRVGAAFNATTWLDRTTYYEVLPVDRLPLAVAIEADRMRRALIREADLERERTVILNELDTGENEPFEQLLKHSFAHAYLEHPYRHPTIGWRGDVEAMTVEVLRRFYDTFYHPDNATVLVVGDIDDAAALAEVERGFGEIPPAGGPFPHPTVRESRQRGERRFVIERAGELGSLALTWHVPEGLHPDVTALNVLTQALSDGVTSRLHQRLVESNRCLGVHAFTFELHDPGVLQVHATLAPGVGHDEVEAAIREEVAALRAAPPTADELARALTQTRTDVAFSHESPAQILGGLTEAVAMGDWRHFPRELEAVGAVKAADVERAAATYLHDRGLTVGWFVPTDNGGGSTVAVAARPEPSPCYLQRPFAERVRVVELDAGTRLAVLTNPHAPTVTIAGTVAAGLWAAADGRFTVPSVAAAMLERGTVNHDRMSLARELEDHGLNLVVRATGFTPASVSFSAQGLADELERLAGLLVEVLRRPTFPADELERLRERILGGLRREREDTFAQAFSALTRHLYPSGHPLHKRTVEERQAELDTVDRDELAAFHRRAYGPDSLVLAVVGAVDPDRVAATLARELDGWSGARADRVDTALPPAPPPGDERLDIADRPNLDLLLGHRGRLRRGDPDQAAAILANSCLGQSALTSRLGMAVRDTAGLSYSVYSRFFGTLELAGPWAASCSVSAANLERAIALCRQVIGDYAADGPTEDELADERQAQSGAYLVGLATNAGIARELVTALTAGEPVSRLDDYPTELLATTRDQVMDAIARHLHPDQLTVAAAGSLSEQSSD
ncbi:MAG TPA: pitrilysin family protein [Methylomirabilota bacterium]|nr:pitrilysin family protein [Methylomirabilota bacterium]